MRTAFGDLNPSAGRQDDVLALRVGDLVWDNKDPSRATYICRVESIRDLSEGECYVTLHGYKHYGNVPITFGMLGSPKFKNPVLRVARLEELREGEDDDDWEEDDA
jgi:hypothetical protein